MVAWQQREIAPPVGVGPEVSCDPASGGTRGQYQGGEYRLMDTQQAVAEGTHTDGQSDSKRDGPQKFTLGPNDSLEGKLTYGGSMSVAGGHAEGEFRIPAHHPTPHPPPPTPPPPAAHHTH